MRSAPAIVLSRHDVWQHDAGIKVMHHHLVGDITLHFNGLDLVGENAQLTVLAAEPGTPDHDSLLLLQSGMPAAQRVNTSR